MGRFCKAVMVLCLAFTLMPGMFEVVENSAHLFQEGHWAHARSVSDHHAPASPEHGCTPTFHLCGCHASLACLIPNLIAPPAPDTQGPRIAALPESPLARFAPRIERPPQA